MASSSSTTRKYDVFLNFRGIDTRGGFTSYLYEALRLAEINTFIDAKLERGEEISPALLQAIESSSISVVIFSQNYASSPYCLDELAKIIECKESTGQVVLPVFYLVDPQDIEEQRGSYGSAFAMHKTKFDGEKGRVEKWKSALREAANLSGWPIADEKLAAECIRGIVLRISKKLDEEKKETLKRNLQELQAIEADLNSRLQSARSFSSERQINKVEIWLSNVGRIKNEAQSMRREWEKSEWTVQFRVRVERLSEEVRGLIDQKGGLEGAFGIDAPQTNEMPTKSLVGQSFQSNIEMILDWLSNDEVSSIGVYGMGGVGKTTLMTHIHNKILENPSKFPHVYWVTVPQDFNVFKLQSCIARAIQMNLGKEKDLKGRAARLSRELNKRHKFVLILDDLWNHFDATEVGIPIGSNGSKLIITTRSVEVCRRTDCNRVKKVEPLNEEEAWELFVKTIGCKLSPKVELIAKYIARKCGGLALAIVTMARSMRGVDDLREWKNAWTELRKSVTIQQDMGEGVFKILKYSYTRLKDLALQQSLMYCALFPKNFWIVKEKLIEYLIVEGIIDGEMGTRQEKLNKGYAMLNKLVNVCLLEQDDRQRVKMHDLTRDMAIQIMKDCQPSIVEPGKRLLCVPDEKYWRKDIVRVSLVDNLIDKIHANFSPLCPKLSTLLLSENLGLVDIRGSFFDNLQGLKVLDLSDTGIMELPESIGRLRNLTALLVHSSRLRYIPNLANLKSLEFLDLSDSKIQKVPEGLELLSNLWHLNLLFTDVQNIPAGMLAKLSHLQFLAFHKSSNYTKELGGLRRLETLYWCFPRLKDLRTFLQLLPTEQIKYYLCVGSELKRCDLDGIGNVENQVIFRGRMIPRQLRKLNFQIDSLTLENVSLKRGSGLCLQNPIGLKSLQIKRCDGIEYLFCSSSLSSIFPSLETLRVSYLHNLNVLFFDMGKMVLSAHNSTLPSCLKELQIVCCSLKKLLPHGLLTSLQNLEKIEVRHCEKLKEIISAEENSDTVLQGLPSLKELVLVCLPNLTTICSQQIKCDCLQSIKIYECEQLKIISICLPLPCLKSIHVAPRWWWKSVKWARPDQKDALPCTELDGIPSLFEVGLNVLDFLGEIFGSEDESDDED